MTDVIIAGIGQTPVQEHWDLSLRELAFMAVEEAVKDAGGMQPQAIYVANMLSQSISNQGQLGALIADFAGLRGIESMTIEAAGASGGAAIRQGFLAIKSGLVDTALIVGVEKVTDKIPAEVEAATAAMMDGDYEAIHGLTQVAQAGMLMKRYMYEYNVPRNAFAKYPLIAHRNGAGNPNAMFRKAIKASLYEKAGMMNDPLNMFDIAPDADGAAAVMLTRPEMLPPAFPHSLIKIIGSSMVVDSLAVHDRHNPLYLEAADRSVRRAVRQARISLNDVDLFELYDLTTIHAVLTLESVGFTKLGEGTNLSESSLSLAGELPISTFGGLKARGNPWGATGVYQAVEATTQLRGVAGDNQVENAQIAMTQCLGGMAATAATHILKRT